MFEKSSPMNEYIEKTSPMKFSPIKIGSPMDENPTVEIGPPMNFREEPSDQDVLSDELVEKGPPMNFVERPSDEQVREALRALLELTRCACDPEDHGGAHHVDCNHPWREDVDVLVTALGIRYA